MSSERLDIGQRSTTLLPMKTFSTITWQAWSMQILIVTHHFDQMCSHILVYGTIIQQNSYTQQNLSGLPLKFKII